MEAQGSELGPFLEENGDFDFPIDLPDDFFDFPSDMETSLIPDIPGDLSSDTSNSGNFGHQGSNEVGNNLNRYTSESGSGGREAEERPESYRPFGVHSPASSHGSGGFVYGASSGINNALSPDSSDLGLDRKDKDGFDGRSSVPKRKKKVESDGDSRSSKYHKSDEKTASTNGEDEKRKARLMRNRESAQISRQRKKQHVEGFEGKVKSMHSTIAELNSKISYIMAENTALRHQISGGGGGPASMYPPMAAPPMLYPWMPYPPYQSRPYGSQVPLVPVPKLKTLLKKPEIRKDAAKSKTKKVASVSFVGILFLIFLFGALVPFVNVNYGQNGRTRSFSSLSIYGGDHRSYDEVPGRVLTVDGQLNGAESSRGSGFSNGNRHSSDRIVSEKEGCKRGLASELGNATEPLFASLYVPRNNKLVKIDRNLIIHSVLASEKAKNASETRSSRETDRTIPRELSSSLAVPEIPRLYRNCEEHPKALLSISAEGKSLHQWFHEGISGALMDHSMCTEVFQFDIPPGAISNISPEHLRNGTDGDKRKNRRILKGLPLPLTASETL